MAYRTMIVAAALMLSGAMAARSQTPPANPGQKSGQMMNMSMDDMMKQCREHCSAAQKQMTDLTKKLDEARDSNDPTKMRAALQDAQKPMMDMKNHVDQCMHMMDMMQNMGGMMKKK